MPYIYGVLCEEYERLKLRKQNYEEELKQLSECSRRELLEKKILDIDIDLKLIEKVLDKE